jgi:TetR/AcrR family transcriptional repressor of nem operon
MPRTARRAETRARIIAAAAAAFRGHGYAATGVDAVMADAGLTHGGFYAHFRSKADLLSATLGAGDGPHVPNPLFAKVAHLTGVAFIEGAIVHYLSRWHRDHPEAGCPIPTLGAELPRLDAALGRAMGPPVQRLGALLEAAMPPPADSAAARARALLSLLVGGVITARALPAAQADAWLESCRVAARGLAGLAEPSP